MAVVHYKFKSAKDFKTVAIEGHSISVGHLLQRIIEKRHLGYRNAFDLVVTNTQTNEDYLDEGMLIHQNTSVSVRRVPQNTGNPIITSAPAVSEQEEHDDVQAVKGNSFAAEEFDSHDFGNDVFAIPETVPIRSSNISKEEEESKIKALINTSTLDWQHVGSTSFGRGMGFGRGGFEKKTPPQGYTCHRCRVAGHFIQHCPTNGDPNFDVKRVKPPTIRIPMPNKAAFEKEIAGMPSTRSVGGDLPPELHCPLCKQVMKNAVFTSKCCFKSFCNTCMRDHIASKAMCVCGATNVLADDLLPNKTLRDTIHRILEKSNVKNISSSSSDDNKAGSAPQVRDTESRNPQAKKVPPTAKNVEENKNSNVSEDTNVKKEGASRRTSAQDENYMMPAYAPCAFNPYNNWNGIQPGFMMPPYGAPMPYMGYGMINPTDATFGGLRYEPFGTPQPHKKSDKRSRDVENDSSAPKKRKLSDQVLSNRHHHEEHKRWERENVVRPLLV